MTSMIPNKRTTPVPVKVKGVENSLTPSEPTKDESRSFLSFSRENLSISHSDLEQGFNKTKPRVRRDTVLSLVAIILALCCVGIQIWKIQGVVDNAREIDVLKREVESMKHRLLEQDLLDELKAFEEQVREIDLQSQFDYLQLYKFLFFSFLLSSFFSQRLIGSDLYSIILSRLPKYLYTTHSQLLA